MPIIRVRKRTRQNREERVRRRALLAIALSMTLFGLFHVPDAVAELSNGPQNPEVLASSTPLTGEVDFTGNPNGEEANDMRSPSFGENLLASLIAPEPGTLPLVGVGIIAFCVAARRRVHP